MKNINLNTVDVMLDLLCRLSFQLFWLPRWLIEAVLRFLLSIVYFFGKSFFILKLQLKFGRKRFLLILFFQRENENKRIRLLKKKKTILGSGVFFSSFVNFWKEREGVLRKCRQVGGGAYRLAGIVKTFRGSWEGTGSESFARR